MSGRTPERLAWGLAALALLLFLSGLVLYVASTDLGGGDLVFEAVLLALVVVFGLVGALIASRHPHNAIGWLFCAVAVAVGVAELASGYADVWIGGGPAPDGLGETAAWYADHSWVPIVFLPPTFVVLLFPSGNLPSRRWRPVAWAAAVGILCVFVGDALRPGPLLDYPQLENPYGVESALLELLEPVGYALVFFAAVLSVSSLVLRFRRVGHDQRQQIKWLAWAGGVAAVMVVANILGYDLVGETVANTLILLSVLALPLAVGIAVLRYRLYDIDVVINRTLVYGALTATLALTYLGVVLLLQLALSPLTEQSDLAIAGSTLAVAALFRPARARIQALVDRRFYRRRYDAARTLERFGARLRDEVDLEALARDLRAAVVETMHPAHASVWLRSGRR